MSSTTETTETKQQSADSALGVALANLINPEALREIIAAGVRRGDVKVTIPGDVVKKILGDQTEAAAKLLTERIAPMAAEIAKGIARGVEIKLPKREPVKIDRPHAQTVDLIKLLETLRPGMRNVGLVGPAGSGKTHACVQAAQALGVGDAFIVGQTLTRYELDGFVDAHGVYRGTTFRRFCESEKGGLYLQDEMDSSSPEALLSLNAYLANGYFTFPDGQTFKRSPRHYVVAACNTFGNGADRIYVGRNQLDGSTKDRYRWMVWNYDEDLEADLVGNEAWHNRVKAVRKAVGSLKLRHTVTPRDAMRGADEIAGGASIAEAETVNLRRDMVEGDWQKVVAKLGSN